jgi:hypothetical protein
MHYGRPRAGDQEAVRAMMREDQRLGWSPLSQSSRSRQLTGRSVGRTAAALLAAVALVVITVTGCSSSKHPKATASTGGGTGGASATAAITSAFTTFFDGSAAVNTRLSYLQNAPVFEQALAAQASSPLIKQTKATVTSVTLAGTSVAKVVYTVSLGTLGSLANQTGTAVLIGGQWKVAATTFCGLIKLEGTPPAACTEATVTALPS